MRESVLQKKVKKEILKKYSKDCWFYHPIDRVQVGIPDILMCFCSRFIAIELKSHKDIKPSKLQAHNLWCIKRSGGIVLWTYSVDEVMKHLEHLEHLKSLTQRNC